MRTIEKRDKTSVITQKYYFRTLDKLKQRRWEMWGYAKEAGKNNLEIKITKPLTDVSEAWKGGWISEMLHT